MSQYTVKVAPFEMPKLGAELFLYSQGDTYHLSATAECAVGTVKLMLNGEMGSWNGKAHFADGLVRVSTINHGVHSDRAVVQTIKGDYKIRVALAKLGYTKRWTKGGEVSALMVRKFDDDQLALVDHDLYVFFEEMDALDGDGKVMVYRLVEEGEVDSSDDTGAPGGWETDTETLLESMGYDDVISEKDYELAKNCR